MTLVVIVIVMLAAFTVVGWPLVRSARGASPDPGDGAFRNDLMARRDVAYTAIKELEFEYQLGNISEQDYRDLREGYRREAAAILRELEAAMGGADAGEVAPSGAPPPAAPEPRGQ